MAKYKAHNKVKQTCYSMLNTFENKMTPSQVMDKCIKSRLMDLYEKDAKLMEDNLDTIMSCIDYNDFGQMKITIKKLKRYINDNCVHLINILERLEN